VHSAREDASEIVAFKRAWGDTLPVIVVPTKYHRTPTDVFRAHRFAAVIWANHMLRASLAAMQEVAARIAADECVHAVEPEVAPLAEVFRLQRVDELLEAERRYTAPPPLRRSA
jgi:phosphoenolpyruvate phosphomutase